jgi:predicted kinase
MLVLLCGTSYSGKSTLARELAPELGAVVVSLDELNERRGLWGGDGIGVEEWIRTHELATAEVRALLDAGRNVILDDTSSLRSLRDRWRSVAADTRVVLIYLDVDHATVRARQSAGDPGRGHVTDAVLEQHLKDFEVPGPDENPVRVRSMAELDLGLVRD